MLVSFIRQIVFELVVGVSDAAAHYLAVNGLDFLFLRFFDPCVHRLFRPDGGVDYAERVGCVRGFIIASACGRD